MVLTSGPDFENDSIGAKVICSANAIMAYLHSFGIMSVTRTISCFLYSPLMEPYWKSTSLEPVLSPEPIDNDRSAVDETTEDISTFYMEAELENFLIQNWEKTELGKSMFRLKKTIIQASNIEPVLE